MFNAEAHVSELPEPRISRSFTISGVLSLPYPARVVATVEPPHFTAATSPGTLLNYCAPSAPSRT